MTKQMTAWIQAAPIALVLAAFLVAPIIMIVIVSFWGATEYSIYPAFEFDNYEFLFGSSVTYTVFFYTFKYAAITWFLTVTIGFTVAYFLAFEVRTLKWQIALFRAAGGGPSGAYRGFSAARAALRGA